MPGAHQKSLKLFFSLLSFNLFRLPLSYRVLCLLHSPLAAASKSAVFCNAVAVASASGFPHVYYITGRCRARPPP
jgi:hypothetical protein